MDHSIINQLEQQIINLTDAFQALRDENNSLRDKHAFLSKERRRLEELNKTAADKIKKIIHKIQAMDN